MLKSSLPIEPWENNVPCSKVVDKNFFHSNHPEQIEAAKHICATCPSVSNCLALAEKWLTIHGREPEGIYGGQTQLERILNKIENLVPCPSSHYEILA